MRAVLLPPLLYGMIVTSCQLATPRRLQWALPLQQAHNVGLALYSYYAFLFTFDKLSVSGRLVRNDWRPLLCDATPGVPAFWYGSKVWEWFDTVLLLARGKTPSVLHLGHHASTASLVALHSMRADGGPPTPVFDVATLLNAFVHVLMYAYYAAPVALAPVKKLITQLQLMQHLTVLGCIGVVLLAGGASGCDSGVGGDAPARAPYLAALNAYGFYLAGFAHFYRAAYRAPRGAGGEAKAKAP